MFTQFVVILEKLPHLQLLDITRTKIKIDKDSISKFTDFVQRANEILVTFSLLMAQNDVEDAIIDIILQYFLKTKHNFLNLDISHSLLSPKGKQELFFAYSIYI